MVICHSARPSIINDQHEKTIITVASFVTVSNDKKPDAQELYSLSISLILCVSL